VFAWQASEKGNDVDLHANPTAGEIYHQEYKQNKDQNKQATQASILDKYGGEEYLKKAPKELLMGQTESYVEYSRAGQVTKGKERAKARSKYQEDCEFSSALCIRYVIQVLSYSLPEQSHPNMGFLVRHRKPKMGLCMLSFGYIRLLLYGTSGY
jgi:hypothetical protein